LRAAGRWIKCGGHRKSGANWPPHRELKKSPRKNRAVNPKSADA